MHSVKMLRSQQMATNKHTHTQNVKETEERNGNAKCRIN